jgi:Domain of unknown function (DUF222)
VSERGIAGDYARTSPTDLLVTTLRVSPTEARARLARARDLGPRRSVVGEALDPILPAAAAAVQAGEISGAHASVITRCIEQIPARIAHEAAPVAERMLVEAARHQQPTALAGTARLLLLRLDPDGAEPRDEQNERRRDFGLREFADGTSKPYGFFTTEATLAVKTILDALAAPQPAVDGLPDDRTPGQRRHDALLEAALRLIRSDTLPTAGGVPVTILASTTITELTSKTGVAMTATGCPMSIPQLLTIACDAQVVPVVFNDAGGILAYGRTRRLASTGQRLALTARDQGCSFPGCTRPPGWTEVTLPRCGGHLVVGILFPTRGGSSCRPTTRRSSRLRSSRSITRVAGRSSSSRTNTTCRRPRWRTGFVLPLMRRKGTRRVRTSIRSPS